MVLTARCLVILTTISILVISPGCSDESGDATCPACPTEPEVETVLVSRYLGPFYPKVYQGDAEYGSGHGPQVKLAGALYIVGGDSLMCHAFMNAQESPPGSNTTKAEVSAEVLLYQAPNGWKIIDTGLDPDTCVVDYYTSDHGMHYVGCYGWAFSYIGDTDGADICVGGDCTQFYLRIRPLVKIQKQ
jgi:hypothetical protein